MLGEGAAQGVANDESGTGCQRIEETNEVIDQGIPARKSHEAVAKIEGDDPEPLRKRSSTSDPCFLVSGERLGCRSAARRHGVSDPERGDVFEPGDEIADLAGGERAHRHAGG